MIRTPRASLALLLLTLMSGPAAANAQTAPPQKKSPPRLARWFDLQQATLGLRYRFIDSSEGVITTNQLQHREGLRARLKADAAGRYALNVGASTGARFTSGWNNTGVGLGDWQSPLSVRLLYVAAQPVTGIEAQYGSMAFVRGESSEITTYDEDGYLIGERLSVRRPRNLFFDEISATVGYIASTADEIGVRKRVKYLGDRPNYWHFLVDKKIGSRGGVSADFTSASSADTWRAAATVSTRELRFADSVAFENYWRTNNNPAYGFALSVNKAATRKLALNGGYASIDRFYGFLNSDRFQSGNRLFVMATYSISARFGGSAFITRAVGNEVPLLQRTLCNLIFTYNALPDLRRTGLF